MLAFGACFMLIVLMVVVLSNCGPLSMCLNFKGFSLHFQGQIRLFHNFHIRFIELDFMIFYKIINC